jgi:iron complex transport system ATP-binding protein
VQSQPFLSCSDLSYFWTPQHGIQNIHLSVKLGERLGIIGPNGAGKSTLLKLFAGLLSPHRGQIMLNGLAIAECSLRDKARSVALLAQEPEPMISSSVYQLIELGLLPHKQLWQCTNQIDKLRIQQVLTQVGLAEKADSMVSWLSGGELQRAQVARVLLQGAQLLLLDEPTNHLDVQYQHELMQMIVNADLTLIASFHDLNLAASYCHTLMLIDQGKVLAYGSPTQVLTTENISKVFCRPCLVDTNPFDGAPRVTFAPGAINE